MKYVKPDITSLASASFATRASLEKKFIEADLPTGLTVAAAYEADE